MSNQRVFIFSSEGVPAQYGIGRYIDILKVEAARAIKHAFVFVSRSDKYESVQIVNRDNSIIIQIPYAKKGRKLSKFSALGILAILDNAVGIRESDIFHFNESEHYNLVEALKGYYGCKIVYVIHFSLWNFFYKNKYSKFLKAWQDRHQDAKSVEISTILQEQLMCHLSDAIITLNEATTLFLEEIYGIDASKIHEIKNGVDVNPPIMSSEAKAAFRYDLGLEKDDKIILYVGRVDEEKGIKFLIQSYLKIEKNHKYKLVIVGHGDINGMLPLIYNKWRNVIFTGYVPASMVFSFYNIADLVVLPSLSEQGSYSILEAISYKKPVLVSDIPAFDYLVSGETAIKVKLSNGGTQIENEDLRIELENFIFDEIDTTVITEKSYKLVKDYFSSTQMFSRLQQVYFS